MVVEASEKNKVVWCYGKKIQLEPRIPGRSIAVPRIAYYNYYLLVVVEASEKNKVVRYSGKKIQLEPRIPGRSIAVPRIAYYNCYLLQLET